MKILQKNSEFRRKTIRAAKIEDLYFKMEEYKSKNVSKEEALKDLQKYIEFLFDYEKQEIVK